MAQEQQAPQVVLEAHGLTKTFGHVRAATNADFELAQGEILAVVGDNGAGKSTLIKMLTGVMSPDSGEILLDGEPAHFASPLDARLAGLECVYQDLAVCPQMDIASNVFMGRELRKGGLVGRLFRNLDKREMRKRSAAYIADLGVGIHSVDQRVETLSGGQRQAVAIARAAAWASKVVIMDEPTAALGVRESGEVLELIQRVKERGLPVVLISHNMQEVGGIADRIHIHRLGHRAAVVDPKVTSMSDVVAVMTGALAPTEVESALIERKAPEDA
ncbi:ATP-binding cassette domain-containing protein [Propionimicrobium sp. PCR01-08-3]|uniref:ATP-binding cassette domain-containing protein n=1 Tax=Propionimicrobium sp. PCR01-08-3 TaxID=3052086 RepID=UPI00255C6C96|nr:ATP-binding cassette domain-containing protein [Propionimicrobium sp. PCR01-08-3]WIY81879.1 ATP-binding cassette domain-containing protein [Propionimicrobium sp. PCR01-08-3]